MNIGVNKAMNIHKHINTAIFTRKTPLNTGTLQKMNIVHIKTQNFFSELAEPAFEKILR